MMKQCALIGLGNPGNKYEPTRHNIGYLLVDELVRRFRIRLKPGRGHFLYGKLRFRGDDFYLLRSTTYMNDSGLAMRDFANWSGIPFDEIIVAFDDFALPFGTLRMRKSGSGGGHNGMESVIDYARSENIPRLRMGIGETPPRIDVVDYVLGQFTPDEATKVPDFIEQAANCVTKVMSNGFEKAMSLYNRPEVYNLTKTKEPK